MMGLADILSITIGMFTIAAVVVIFSKAHIRGNPHVPWIKSGRNIIHNTEAKLGDIFMSDCFSTSNSEQTLILQRGILLPYAVMKALLYDRVPSIIICRPRQGLIRYYQIGNIISPRYGYMCVKHDGFHTWQQFPAEWSRQDRICNVCNATRFHHRAKLVYRILYRRVVKLRP